LSKNFFLTTINIVSSFALNFLYTF
jgi:hypothetical protein